MFCVNTVPPLCNAHRRSVEKAGDVPHHEIINIFAIENINEEPIFMRIAERKLAGSRLGDKSVDAPSIVFGSLLQDSLFERGQRAAHAERWIKPQRQARSKCRSKAPPGGLRFGPQHLQLYASETGTRVDARIQGLEIVAAANDCTVYFPPFVPRFHNRQLDISDS